uniref:BTB domain-containing protein n=1 Tax=Aplanochytrium stocchinoi TaxID=215587 RepID=A0A7S3V0T6_9STRA|mmetsp:Transcript_7990/g.9494  ORF Transcript_7990/g.9494 Transcript_7990/m.9494 type:complete len:318 (-) Transcript_7990:98-1051(-)
MSQKKRAKVERVNDGVNDNEWVFENVINLNVGGHYFSTALSTLQSVPDSMLGSLFSGRHKPQKDAEGRYFIDRDGTHFRYILNALRDGPEFEMEVDEATRKEFMREVKYYGLENFIKTPKFSNSVSWTMDGLKSVVDRAGELPQYHEGVVSLKMTSPWLKFNMENCNHRYQLRFIVEVEPDHDTEYEEISVAETEAFVSGDIAIILSQDDADPNPPLWPASGSLEVTIHSNNPDKSNILLKFHKRNPEVDFEKNKEYKYGDNCLDYSELAEDYGLVDSMKLTATYKPPPECVSSARTTAAFQMEFRNRSDTPGGIDE